MTNQVPKTDELRQLVLDVAELKWRVSEPEAKLAQRFFDATGFERELSLVYELYDAEASRGSLEQAGKSLRGMRRLQQSAAVLEIFIVVVYALEAAHLLSGLGAHESLFPVTLAYLVAGPLVIGALVYWQHHRQKRANLRWLAAGYVVLILVGAALAIYSRDENERKHGEQEDRVKVLMDRLAEKKESTKEK